MAKWRKPGRSSVSPTSSVRRAQLETGQQRASWLLDRQNYQEAFALLEPLADDFPEDGQLQLMLGLCHLDMDNPDAAVDCFEKSYALAKLARAWYPLGVAYQRLGLNACALHAFNESARHGLPLPAAMQPTLAGLREDVNAAARAHHVSTERTLAGLCELEHARRFLSHAAFQRAIAANRAAISVFGDWAPPHNNLSLVLFFDGQLAAAITETQLVLRREPENIMAAGNLIRFLVWTGERVAAEAIWDYLRVRTPLLLPNDALKLGETAALMEDDERVYHHLAPLADLAVEEAGGWLHYEQMHRFLAIAAANLGDPESASRQLRSLNSEQNPHVTRILAALAQGKASLGLTSRFSYFPAHELMPVTYYREFIELVAAAEGDEAPKAVKALARFALRFPQLVVMAEKQIWEEDTIDVGLTTLRYLGTPAAHAALRRFGGSQAGAYEKRMDALFYLQASGGAQADEPFMVWNDGAWHETRLRRLAIGPRYDHPPYQAKVLKLIEGGLSAFHAGEYAEAAIMLRQAIAIEPRAFEAMNNLSAVLERMGDKAGSRALLEQALAINPLYVFARVNLALSLIASDVDAAAAMLKPLEDVTAFTAEEFAFYQFGLAEIAIMRGAFETARMALQAAISIYPNLESAAQLLDRLDDIEVSRAMLGLLERFSEMNETRNTQSRLRQQRKLTTLTPSLAAVVESYPVDLLRPIAKTVTPARSVTGFRKAELQRLVTETMLASTTVTRLLREQLTATECAALAAILTAGGAMPQEQFRTVYGDDTSESPSWRYHAPTSVAGRLRLHCLLVETTVDGTVYLAIPVDLRGILKTSLNVPMA